MSLAILAVRGTVDVGDSHPLAQTLSNSSTKIDHAKELTTGKKRNRFVSLYHDLQMSVSIAHLVFNFISKMKLKTTNLDKEILYFPQIIWLNLTIKLR